jgi:peptidoglycan hydrolase CwlO-like protein
MTIGQALVHRKEVIIKKNALEARLKEGQSYKVHLESGTEVDRMYTSAQFDLMKVEADTFRKEIQELKKQISKANQIVLPGKKCVQDLVIEIGSQKDLLALLNELRSACKGGGDRWGNREEGVVARTTKSAVELDAEIDQAQSTIDALNKEITSLNGQIGI